ncbi:Lumazine synthase [Thamnocephalis sphaerospora]|uniref:6,7-dimethyl-8-ribityllumazine synthase n=1 Tax=Thamnocephalis sphaerospora TaxID=78915 RepID=A0A4P9XWC5_9FUNG|nr:Lumazine synthase [Thamnocephalis sphaerospora]|eukprot:RKP10608.1 Lumazine synthase [Thamnocephalis sphaerospora]
MSTSKDFSKGLPTQHNVLDGSKLRVLIVHARWNEKIVGALVNGAIEALVERHQVPHDHITIETVPGSYELPFAARRLLDVSTRSGAPRAITATQYGYDAVITIGVLIKGETQHFEYISEAVTHGLTRVGLDTGVPVIFGVLTCLSDEQALARAGLTEKGHNHGLDWGSAAVEMALLGQANVMPHTG